MPFKNHKPLFRIPSPKSAQPKPYTGQSSRKSAPEFTFFPRLPIEIRLAIWELALPEPRVLGLTVHRTHVLNGVIHHFQYLHRLAGTPQITSVSFSLSDMTSSMKLMHNGKVARVPIALRVCRDSRYVAMKRYRLSFHGCFDDEYKRHKKSWDLCVSEEKKTWFDFENDVLFVDIWQECLGLLIQHCLGEVNNIRKVAVAGKFTWKSAGYFRYGFVQLFKSFINLREVQIWDSFDFAGIKGMGNAHSEPLPTKEVVRNSVLQALTHAKESDAEWTAELPAVKVVRHWDVL